MSDYNENGVFAEENFEPDLKFAQNSCGNFAVECKWRSRFQENGFIKWSYPEQIERYYRYQKENDVPVFIALGIGGQPDHPQEFYLVPLFRLTKEFANKQYITEFLVTNEKDIENILENKI